MYIPIITIIYHTASYLMTKEMSIEEIFWWWQDTKKMILRSMLTTIHTKIFLKSLAWPRLINSTIIYIQFENPESANLIFPILWIQYRIDNCFADGDILVCYIFLVAIWDNLQHGSVKPYIPSTQSAFTINMK